MNYNGSERRALSDDHRRLAALSIVTHARWDAIEILGVAEVLEAQREADGFSVWPLAIRPRCR